MQNVTITADQRRDADDVKRKSHSEHSLLVDIRGGVLSLGHNRIPDCRKRWTTCGRADSRRGSVHGFGNCGRRHHGVAASAAGEGDRQTADGDRRRGDSRLCIRAGLWQGHDDARGRRRYRRICFDHGADRGVDLSATAMNSVVETCRPSTACPPIE